MVLFGKPIIIVHIMVNLPDEVIEFVVTGSSENRVLHVIRGN